MTQHHFEQGSGCITARCGCGRASVLTTDNLLANLDADEVAALFPAWAPRGGGCPACRQLFDDIALIERIAPRVADLVLEMLLKRLRGF